MLSREDLEAFRERHVQARTRLIANVNVAQGAIDAATQLLALLDRQEKEAEEAAERAAVLAEREAADNEDIPGEDN